MLGQISQLEVDVVKIQNSLTEKMDKIPWENCDFHEELAVLQNDVDSMRGDLRDVTL